MKVMDDVDDVDDVDDMDDMGEPAGSQLPPHAQRQVLEHLLAVLESAKRVHEVNLLGQIEYHLQQGNAVRLASVLRGQADSCRRNIAEWSAIADHFDAMAHIMEVQGEDCG
ncbi:RNA-binding protein [Nocardioides okcheonensis]|uniref:hypothetical protein n=1 Tax=Nocardioides okcheonensis TaxID=2894081 RepID=UPI001E4E14AC|nr:hypothetical protein [Nocardioides okcheonensis]UFN45110.1 hypothetical protein LN652_02495 [Nocardioides okcheonensis]